MSRAREFADLAGSADAGGITGKNMVTNGSMTVAQRGTSSTGQTSGGYKTCDRWRVSITTQGTWTISQSSTTPNSDFSSSLKFDCTTADASPAASDQVAVETRLEAQDVAHLGYGNSDAKAITVSFWVRSNKTGTYTFEVFAQDPNRLNSTTYTIDSANTWEKKEITIPADTSGSGINSDSGIGIIVKWWLGAGSTFTGGTFTNNVWEANVNANRVHSSQVNLADSTSNEWYITGVQLELGEQATPFEHRSFGDELARCRRYFEKSYDVGTTPGTSDNKGTENWTVNSEGNANAIIRPSFNVEKRAAPTMVAYQATGTSGSWNYERSGVAGTGTTTFDRKGTNGCRAYVPIGANFASAYIFGHWTADAEL
jgi:hypothetical protein